MIDSRNAERDSNSLRNDGRQSPAEHGMRLHSINALGSDITHRLSQPLTALTYYCGVVQQLALDSPELSLSAELNKYVEKMAEQAKRTAEILEDYRRQAGSALRPEGIIRVDTMLEEAVTIMRPLTEARSICLISEIDAELPLLAGDRYQIREVILNLINNSLDALEGERNRMATICVSAKLTRDGIEFSVVDNGPGLDEDQVKRMFELFDTNQCGKVRLGLAISRSIVQAHDGKLWFERVPGGAIFRFLIPTGETVNAQ